MLDFYDWVLVAFYFLIIIVLGYFILKKKREITSSNYFLAGRNNEWFIIGASLFAANIGSEHLVGLAGTGSESGVAVAQFEILACFMLLILGWLFAPFYLKSGVYTMPEFLEKRYSRHARWYLATISIIGYVLTKISVTIAAGGIVFEVLMNVDFWVGAFIVVLFTGIYTILGGLKLIMVTEALQTFILILGSVLVLFFGLHKIGGWHVMWSQSEANFMSLWRPVSDPSFPWTGILFGAPILGVWYWCTDQFIVQRVLSAKNINEARGGTILAGFFKLLPLFIFVIPGVIATCLFKRGDLIFVRHDQALPALIGYLLPSGIRGIVVAGLLAALMSSLSAVFNSCSTLITWDIYKKLRPDTPDRKLVIVGRISTLFLVILGILWIPIIKLIAGGLLYKYLQSVQAYISPPIAAVFLLGIFWKRMNSFGAMASLLCGFFLGIGRLFLEIIKPSLSGILFKYADLNFLHFAVVLFFVCVCVLISVSLLTSEESASKLKGLTFQTVSSSEFEKSNFWVVFGSIMLVILVFGIWLYFS